MDIKTLFKNFIKLINQKYYSKAETHAIFMTNDNPQLSEKEDISNKTITLNSTSTDTQYPSAKCVYDSIQSIDCLTTDDIINDLDHNDTNKVLSAKQGNALKGLVETAIGTKFRIEAITYFQKDDLISWSNDYEDGDDLGPIFYDYMTDIGLEVLPNTIYLVADGEKECIEFIYDDISDYCTMLGTTAIKLTWENIENKPDTVSLNITYEDDTTETITVLKG